MIKTKLDEFQKVTDDVILGVAPAPENVAPRTDENVAPTREKMSHETRPIKLKSNNDIDDKSIRDIKHRLKEIALR